jgi:hypothetical protein
VEYGYFSNAILVVVDSLVVVPQMLQRKCGRTAYTSTHAESGPEFLQRASRYEPTSAAESCTRAAVKFVTSARAHVRTPESLNGVYLNYIYTRKYTAVCRHMPVLVKIGQQ